MEEKVSIKDQFTASMEELETYYSTQSTEGLIFHVERPDINVKAIREGLKMSQREFAEIFKFSLKTIQNWEQKIREPEGPARAYLAVIMHAPDAVQEALSKEKGRITALTKTEHIPNAA